MIYKYFKDQKSISLKELIEYMHNLYKKSKKENSKLYFKFTPFYTMLLEMVVIFILLSENNQLKLTKLEKVFKEETLDDVKINTINTGNVIINMIRAINYWNFARLKSIL
jgi:membrane-associated HD superfamily phosphohydrolase